MHYDPIKKILGKVFNKNPFLRRLFYSLLNILLLRSWHVRKALKICGRRLPRKASVLDAGTGYGQYTWWMASRFPEWIITAIDVKTEQVEDCNSFFRKTGVSDRVKAVEADLVTWNNDQKNDLILCVDVMEHIEEDTMVFSNFYNAMNNNALLIISTPSDKGGSDVHEENDPSFISEHVRDGYSTGEITNKLNEAGFGKVSVAYTYGAAGSVAWSLSMKYPVKMLSLTKFSFAVLPIYYLLVMPLCLILNFIDLRVKHTKGTGLLVIAEKAI